MGCCPGAAAAGLGDAAVPGAFAKGKGKGKKGGGGNLPFRPPTGVRGGGKGGAGGGKGGFSGACFHCHEPGHQRSECPKYTAFLQAQGKGGGAGPGYLNQVGSDEAFGFGLSSLPEEEANAEAWALGAAEGT